MSSELDSTFTQPIADDELVTLSARNARRLLGRVFGADDDRLLFAIPGGVLRRLRALAEVHDKGWVEDHSMEAVRADGDKGAVLKLSPSLIEDLRTLRAAKLDGPLVF